MLRHAPILLFAVLVTCVLTPLAAFGLAWQYTDARASHGTEAVFLEASDGSTPAAQFRTQVEAFAREHNVTVTVEYLNPDAPAGDSALYATGIAKPTQHASFIRGRTVTTSPLSSFPVDDARYLYTLSGPAGSDEKFLRLANDSGYDGMVMQSTMAATLLESQSSRVIGLLVLTVITAAATHAIVRTRATGINRLHGRGLRHITADDLRGIALPTFAMIVVAVIATALALFFYNGFVGFGLLSLFAAAVSAIAVLAGIIGYLIGYAVSCSTGILGAIKGAEPGRALFTGVIAVRMLALLLTLTLAGSATSAAVEYSLRLGDAAAWQQRSEAMTIGIAGGASSDFGTFAPALRKLDAEGDLILADPYWALGTTPTEHPLMLVNRTFAAHEAGIDPLALPDDPHTVTIASPAEPTTGWTRDWILESIAAEADFGGSPPPPVVEITYPANREVFTYDPSGRATITDPILIILPLGLATLSDRNLTATLNSATALLGSQGGVDKLKAQGGVGSAIGVAAPIADTWAKSFAQARSSAFNFGYAFLVSLALTTFLAAAGALSYQLVHRRRLAVGFLLGRHPWRDRLGLAITELVFLAIPVLWLTRRLLERAQQAGVQMPSTLTLGFQSAMSPAMIALTMGCAVAWCGVSILTVARLDAHRKDQP